MSLIGKIRWFFTSKKRKAEIIKRNCELAAPYVAVSKGIIENMPALIEFLEKKLPEMLLKDEQS